MLLWLWRRPADVVLIRPLAWELPNAVGPALKSKNEKQPPPPKTHSASAGLLVTLEHLSTQFNNHSSNQRNSALL